MTQDLSQGAPNLDALGYELPTPEEGLVEAKRRIAQTMRRSELVWLMQERYDPTTPAWNIDVVRQGMNGSWVRQRARFDEQAQVLYYMGETPLSEAEFRAARKQGQIFPVAEWQDRSA
ncbi:MAG TPA: hypothetical protein VFU22_09495 [Roseiflexaceae bacterium]|nr:hypothetical protein [Roseiflexaceae bacterium]